jgi:hypothetical protein
MIFLLQLILIYLGSTFGKKPKYVRLVGLLYNCVLMEL